MKRKGLFTAFFALIFLAEAAGFTKGDSLYIAQLNQLANYYKPLLKSARDLENTAEEFSTKKIEDLFREMNTEMRIELNPDVLYYIHQYTTDQKNNFEVALSLESLYEHEINQFLTEKSLPRELIFLPLALTGMNNQATTQNNGSGIWALNYYTALKYGLTVNAYRDDRKNPELSTQVALDYLNELHTKYKSWNLAITAFATSQGLVNKAITHSGNKTNYWEIAPYLTIEARQIIPAFFAAVYVAKFYPEHDMNPPGILISSSSEILDVQEAVSLDLLAKQLKVSSQSLKLMNPVFRGETIVPNDKSGIEFKIPEGFTYLVTQVEKSLYSETKKLSEPTKVLATTVPPSIPEGTIKKIYIVQSGDYLGKIAEDHGLRVSYVKRWNYLKSDRINIGQKLTLYVKPGAKTQSERSVVKVVSSSPPTDIKEDQLQSYTVKEGDSLWEIARNHPGNDIETIQRINQISDSIQPGQVIKILKQP